MLPVKEITVYARGWARKHRVKDVEEVESVAVMSLWLAELDKQNSTNLPAYYRRYANFRLLQHFFNKKLVGQLPDDFDMEYDPVDKIKEAIEGLKLTPLEHDILQQRLKGYNDKEVADINGMSQQWINKVRKEIRRRTNETELFS